MAREGTALDDGDRATLAGWLERMLVIRRTEERLIHLREDERLIRGHYHVSIGQEATAVAVCGLLAAGELLFTTHRNHGHILARGGEPEPLMAEILGRRTGYNGGRGGTLHPVVPQLGIVHTSAIVGGSLGLAAGAAFAAARRGGGRAVVAFFGDGVLEEGVFAETVNMAALWRLPLLMVCEDNSVAPEARAPGQYPSSTLAAQRLSDLPASLSIPTEAVDGADLQAVAEAAGRRLEAARRGEGPAFLQTRTERWPGNYGIYPSLLGSDTRLEWAWDPAGAPEPLRAWADRADPVLRAARRLLETGAVSREELLALDGRVRQAVERAAQAATAAPPPAPDAAYAHVFAPEEV